MDPELKIKVLIAEDDPIVGLDLNKSLTSLGYKIVGQAKTGTEIVDMALMLKPDIILMDIKLLGVVDGIESAKVIRLRSGTPVIFVTAYSDEKIVKRANEIDPSAIIIKPYKIEEIDSAIKEALTSKDQ